MAGLQVPEDMDGQSIAHLLLPITSYKLNYERFEKNKIKTTGSRELFLYTHDGEYKPITDGPCSEFTSNGYACCNPDYNCKCQDAVNNTYACIRHLTAGSNYAYCQFYDEISFLEVYNIEEDPDQMVNIADTVDPELIKYYEAILPQLLECKGKSCHEFWWPFIIFITYFLNKMCNEWFHL